MAQSGGAPGPTHRQTQGPEVRRVTIGDLLEVLAAGLRDFRRAPLHGVALGGIYAVGGWMLILLLFVATGFYAVSVCLERGEPVTWSAIHRLVRTAGNWDLGWMALVTGFAFFIWMDIAALLFFGFLGLNALSSENFILDILTSPTGLMFLVIGNSVGAVIALGVFSFSVTSFPMLFERDCDFVTAMVTSVRVVLANRRVMVIWCALIAILIGLSLLSGLVGLFIVLPVLGHASWHLYRRAVAPAGEAEAQ
jgi:uncharacterized membrane protein